MRHRVIDQLHATRRIHAFIKFYLDSGKQSPTVRDIVSLIYAIDCVAIEKLGVPIFFSQYMKADDEYMPVTTINLKEAIKRGMDYKSDVNSVQKPFTRDEWDIIALAISQSENNA